MSMKTKECCGKLGGKAGMCMKTKVVVRRDKPAGSRGCKILTRKE
jgi:hypothetical protein